MENYNMITIDDLKNKIDRNSRLVGLDIGTKRIGISICDDKRSIATPLITLEYSSINNLIHELDTIIFENNIKAIIIGNPINMDGSLGKSSQSASDFSKNLSKNITIPITMWDERLSSDGSFRIIKDLGTNTSNKVKKLDKNAAAFILQGAIDFFNN